MCRKHYCHSKKNCLWAIYAKLDNTQCRIGTEIWIYMDRIARNLLLDKLREKRVVIIRICKNHAQIQIESC